ncbi:Cysteine/Histidine-rich C1 domain family protein [Striga hermonthica]|uniref:Cysteine/Histidine-rich C1 domain family protein n=1 Tax=Striga hermonthica TaxID=68872 RepID=A0A9N7NAG8_STRHE|nr:Cysteine/Histidine-rich C1 domain family protein [Striga hermonthica]
MRFTEISHFSHTHHKLKYHRAEAPFKCDGCKEIGIGSAYKCGAAACDYDLHTHCAVPSPSIAHPFYTGCSFQFLSRPPGTEARYCNACERPVTGFLYHWSSSEARQPGGPSLVRPWPVKWQLLIVTSIYLIHVRCGRKGRSWSYRSSCKKYNLHVACVKDMLVDSWHELYDGVSYSDKSERRVPSLKATLEAHTTHKRPKGKAQKCCEVAGLALQFVVSAVLGDPTILIAGIVGTLMSK